MGVGGLAAAAWPCPYLCLRLWRVCDLTDKLTARRAQRTEGPKGRGFWGDPRGFSGVRGSLPVGVYVCA